jgi:site-specific DNA-methyltransferase (adenine-specific)
MLRKESERMTAAAPAKRQYAPPSTVGRGKTAFIEKRPTETVWQDDLIKVELGDSLHLYPLWEKPTVIVSDGGYGVLGFEGDTSDHLDLPQWYETHVRAWADFAQPSTTLWFWNSEIGWAAVHPILEKYGWRYVNCNIWNKGRGHIAGNVNTGKIRRFPVVTEVCVQYVFEARIQGKPLKEWLLSEWKRTGLPVREANKACGVADAATRKYLDQGHLWYFPPADVFVKMQEYANLYGERTGRPYFSIDGKGPATAEDWVMMRSKFDCPHGVTNVWERPALRGKEREKVAGLNGKAIHLNQKPCDLLSMVVQASSKPGDVIWEPFGGLFTTCLAARKLGRRAFGGEIDPAYFHFGVERIKREVSQQQLPLSSDVLSEQPQYSHGQRKPITYSKPKRSFR